MSILLVSTRTHISLVSVWSISESSDDEKQKQACNLIKEESLAQVFSFFAEHLRTTASQKSISKAKYT